MAPIRSRTRARGTARAAPYKRPVAKTTARKVDKILRFIKTNKPELKIAKYSADANYTNNSIKSFNVAYHMMAQGTNENSFIGKKLNMKYLTVKYVLKNDAATALSTYWGNFDTIWRVSLVATKTFRTSTSLTGAEIYDDSFNGTGYTGAFNPMYDSDKIKILTQKVIHLKPLVADEITLSSGAPMVRYGKINFRLNRTMEFRDWNSSFEGKNMNYYILVETSSQGNSTGILKTGSLSFQAKLSFTDD